MSHGQVLLQTLGLRLASSHGVHLLRSAGGEIVSPLTAEGSGGTTLLPIYTLGEGQLVF